MEVYLYLADSLFPPINPVVLLAMGMEREDFILGVLHSEQFILNDPDCMYQVMNEMKDDAGVPPSSEQWLREYEHEYLSIRHILCRMTTGTGLAKYNRLNVFCEYHPTKTKPFGYMVILFADD